MCLARRPQRSDAGEARTRGPSVSSQALYHREADRIPVEIRVVLGCVFNLMMCSKVIYTGLIKTEIGKLLSWSLCNMRKILVESPRKIWLSIR